MTGFRVGLLLAVLFAVGCNDAPDGPTAVEFSEKRKALEARVADRGSQPQKARTAPTAQAKPAASGASFARLDEDYVFDPTGKRDPFRNFKWERPDRLRDRDVAGPLEQFDLSQLEVVAVVWKTGNARALVEDPSGTSYIIAEGARVGKNEGHVISIEDNQVRVKETYVDFLGRETTKDIDMRMRGSEGG